MEAPDGEVVMAGSGELVIHCWGDGDTQPQETGCRENIRSSATGPEQGQRIRPIRLMDSLEPLLVRGSA